MKIYGEDDEIEEVNFVKHKIKKTPLPKGGEHITFDNVVNVSEETLQSVLNTTNRSTKKIVKTLLQHIIPTALSYDNATTYIEAALKDGLDIDLEIETDVLVALNQLSKLSIIYSYCRQIELPARVRQRYLEGVTDEFVKELMVEMKKSNNTRKYSQTLREAVAHVKSKNSHVNEEESPTNKVGLKRSKK